MSEEARMELDEKDQRIEELETRLDRMEKWLDEPDTDHKSTAPADH